MADLDGIDLADLAFWRRPPHERLEAFRALRDLDRPVFFPERRVPFLRPGRGFHALVRHADVVEASRDAASFSSEPAVTSPEPPPWTRRVFGDSMVNLDDPRHARLRRIVSRAFSPKTLARLDAHLAETAAAIVDEVRAAGPGDFVSQVAARFPIQVICHLMGIPERERPRVHAHADASTEYTGVRADLVRAVRLAARNARALLALQRMVARLGEERRDRPGDDLVSALVNADVDGERLSGRELGSFFTLLLVAGNETTRNALAHALKLFTDHPEQRELLLSDFDARIGPAVEEIVRFSSPVMQFRRRVTRDLELRGHPLRAGDRVSLLYVSANRDESVFADPDVFDITRRPNPHVGFGGPSPHHCLGAHLARREMAVMLRELFTRLPGIRATAEPEPLISNFDNGVWRQPYTFRG
ncbi:cytochrome P450 [Bailinhaonella thermotolerans]|uniref:Cytochrome P450 n=1 Tax=Bailinhaonella thermotolerans TaxID=1070861 RepID=A0A3A4A2T9_9ACTN|nr:cytochrome P450 [Bailinhaonella thermotolerans]RJL22745.1 cytochrome P450 [Bailinhaonella thermotolerans]